MNKYFFSIFIIIILFLTSCYYNNEEDLYKHYPSAVCDTTEVTYYEHLKQILDKNCATCHGEDNFNCKLNNFENAHAYAIKPNTNLYSVVATDTHKGITLSDCQKKQLQIWINTGAK